MPNVSITIGSLLILLGAVSYLLSGGQSLTALIPSAVGILLTALGFVGRKEKARRHAMHAASAVGLLAMAGSASGFIKLFTLLGGGEVQRPAAVVVQAIMFILSALFVGMAVNSFIQARRKKGDELPPSTR